MAIVVPFDGSTHARLALARAADLADAFQADLLAVTVVHRGVDDPVELGWLEDGESYDPGRIEERLAVAVEGVAPEATHHAIRADSRLPRGAVAKHLRRFARDHDADLVFIGSENAGRIVSPVSSVGGGVATEMTYDVYLVRRTESSLFDDRGVDVSPPEPEDEEPGEDSA